MKPGAGTPERVRLNEGLAPAGVARLCLLQAERASPRTGESKSPPTTVEPQAASCGKTFRREPKTPPTGSAPKNCWSEPAGAPLAPGRAAQAEAATNEARVRGATEANGSESAKTYCKTTETRATAANSPATNKPKLAEVNDWPAGRRRTGGPRRCKSELVFGQKPTPKRIKGEADKNEFGEGLTFELTGVRQSGGAG